MLELLLLIQSKLDPEPCGVRQQVLGEAQDTLNVDSVFCGRSQFQFGKSNLFLQLVAMTLKRIAIDRPVMKERVNNPIEPRTLLEQNLPRTLRTGTAWFASPRRRNGGRPFRARPDSSDSWNDAVRVDPPRSWEGRL